MKITIEHYGRKSTVELEDESTVFEVLEAFMRLLVSDTYAWEAVVGTLPDLLAEYCDDNENRN